MTDEARCIQANEDECAGEVEYRESLSGTGTPIPRCGKHWTERLALQRNLAVNYPDSSTPPSWFDPANAGETWDDDY